MTQPRSIREQVGVGLVEVFHSARYRPTESTNIIYKTNHDIAIGRNAISPNAASTR